VIVMAEGRVLTHGSMAEIRRNDAVIEAYLGARQHRQDHTSTGEPCA
jgi:ABC-type uncharacterized transport system ATPase subunit